MILYMPACRFRAFSNVDTREGPLEQVCRGEEVKTKNQLMVQPYENRPNQTRRREKAEKWSLHGVLQGWNIVLCRQIS